MAKGRLEGSVVWVRVLSILGLLSVLCTAPGCGGGEGGGEADVGTDTCSCDPDAACTALDPACEDSAACEEDCAVDHECLEGACVDGACVINQPDPLCCVLDLDCDDLNPCTAEVCQAGQCVYVDLEDCCLLDLDCDDGNFCTRDRCVDGVCIHPWWEDEAVCICTSDASCDDGNGCTLDQCLESQCVHQQVLESEDCCATDEDCDDGDDTTVDLCVEFLCIHPHTMTCMVDAQCDDGDLCTEDLCIGGYCNVGAAPDPLCCTLNSDCDDGVECSRDRCVDGACTWTADLTKPGCCTDDAQCEDGIPCTQDVCAGFTCDWLPQEEGCCHDAADCPEPTKPCREATCEAGVCGYANQINCCTTAGECDDGDPCTQDTCEFGQCFWYDVQDCCTTDEDCDDGALCTEIVCVNGSCGTPQIIEGCCTNAGMCNDSDPCTFDTCGEDNQCQYQENPDCCHEDWECEGDKVVDCQIPHCVNGNCVLELGLDCCITDEDCQDFDPECTIDTCGDDNTCIHALADAPGCCLEDADCALEDPCIGGTCKTNHQCEFAPVPNCCEADADCDDGDELCTLDSCVDNICVYTLTEAEGCCLTADDCVPEDLCDAPTCGADHLCTFTALTAPECCHDDGECDDGDECTADACLDDACVYTPTGGPGCCEPELLVEGFENSPEGWVLENSSGAYGWSFTGVKAADGAMSLGYSNGSGTDYGTDNWGTALSPAVELPQQPGLSLSFSIWYSTESGYDVLTVRVLTDAGPMSLAVYQGYGNGWEQADLDLTPWAGQIVQIEFSFSCDSSYSEAGVFIDGLIVGQACCNDDGDCDDGDPCTADMCPGEESLCLFTPIPGCCVVDGGCDDEDPCTEDHCVDGQCVHLESCCEADEECDDGDDLCTEDLCVDGFCQFVPNGAPGCCSPELFDEGFETGQGAWEFDNADPTVGWHITAVKAAAGGHSLAFSDAAGQDYGIFNSGSALSPAVDLPDQPGPTLSFKLWYQVVLGDSLSVTVVTDDGEATLAEYSGTAALWQQVSLPLSDFAGQTVRIRFDFQSGWTGGSPGIFIDELRLFHTCCDADTDCDDGNPCTEDSCPGVQSLCAHLPISGCCLPDCEDMECGDDGCGGSCGSCPEGIPCDNGQCIYPCGDGVCGDGEDSCDCPEDCPDDPYTCSSCECGGSGGGSCFCDAGCVDWGDCCANVCDACGFCGGW